MFIILDANVNYWWIISQCSKSSVTVAIEMRWLLENRVWGYKTFFMLTSTEHEILNAHSHKNYKKMSFFQAQISLEYYFS